MKIIFMDEEVYSGDDKAAIPEILHMVSESISSKGLQFSHLLVDGVEIFENPDEFLLTATNEVERVKIVVTTVNELLADAFISLQGYLTRSIPEISKLSEEFYQNPSDSTWDRLGQLFEGLQWMGQIFSFITKNDSLANYADFAYKHLNFHSEIQVISEAVDQKDINLLGDVLSYDFIPRFTSIQKELEQFFLYEVPKDVN